MAHNGHHTIRARDAGRRAGLDHVPELVDGLDTCKRTGSYIPLTSTHVGILTIAAFFLDRLRLGDIGSVHLRSSCWDDERADVHARARLGADNHVYPHSPGYVYSARNRHLRDHPRRSATQVWFRRLFN